MSFQRKALGSLMAGLLFISGQAFAEAPTVSGFVDAAYNYNLNGELTNTLRGFDSNANSFTLQNAEVVFAGKGSKDITYRVDLNYGTDASKTNYANTFNGTEFDIQQAFISAPCPMTGGVFTIGKFVTMHGAEVIEAKDNFNTSRGLLFNYAIPFNHTGVKYDKTFGDLGLSAGLVNGWDNQVDNNTGKTAHVQVSKPLGKFKVILGGAYGPEIAASSVTTTSQYSRSLVDAVVSYAASDKLTLIANVDWGVEEGLGAVSPDNQTQNWLGAAVHGKYAFSDALAAALRYENFDDDGSRTATGMGPVVLQSLTATLEHKMNDVITRFEVRQDTASKDVFTDSDGAADDSQTTLGVQWIYSF